jgi:uncharacterized membrane protein
MKFKAFIVGVTGLCGMLAMSAASAWQNKFLTFEVPEADTTAQSYNGTFPQSINDWGVIIGSYIDANDVYHGFIRSPDGKFTSFEAPGADTTQGSYNGTQPNSINDCGEITGNFSDAQGVVHGFLRSPDGKFTKFDVPGAGGYSNPLAINLEGEIVGDYLDSASVIHAFLRHRDGTFSTFLGPDGCDTSLSTGCYGTAAFSINIFGAIAAAYEDKNGNFVDHGLLRTPAGKFTPFEAPGAGTGSYQGTGCRGCSLRINDSGTIAGTYLDATNVSHAFLRTPEGVFTTVDAPGAGFGSYQGTGCSSDCPIVVNDAGFMAGTYIDANNTFHGYLRSPAGKVVTLDAPGAGTASFQGTACQFCGLDINQWGAIAGTYIDSNNVYHGFLRLP